MVVKSKSHIWVKFWHNNTHRVYSQTLRVYYVFGASGGDGNTLLIPPSLHSFPPVSYSELRSIFQSEYSYFRLRCLRQSLTGCLVWRSHIKQQLPIGQSVALVGLVIDPTSRVTPLLALLDNESSRMECDQNRVANHAQSPKIGFE
jgi:hypothetical protein